MIKLNLACGKDYREGWVNIDNKQMYGGDFKVDLDKDIFETFWPHDSVDLILVNHFIQYVTPEKMDILLKRWLGWLKHGGAIYIEAGDVLSVARRILESKTIEELHDKDAIMQLYGVDENIWNKWAWTPASLTSAMDRAGFKELFTGRGYFHQNPSRDFLTVGYKVDERVPAKFFPPLIPDLMR